MGQLIMIEEVRLVFIWTVVVLFSSAVPGAQGDKLNVVFILSDNQSYYEMSCHGHAQIKTPRIDRLAEQSVEFKHFYAPPYCSPSRTTLMTGRYAMRAGVFDTIGGRSIMHRDAVTLPSLLRQHGYRTAIFGKWHLGFSYPYRPQDRGFEEVFVHGGGGIGQLEDLYRNTLFDTSFMHNGTEVTTQGYCTDTLFSQALHYIEDHRHEPIYCFVSTPVTHSPHHGPKQLVADMKAAGVDGNVELFAQVQNLDTNIGRLLDKLDDLELAEKTVVVYASDQGMNDRGAPHGMNRLGIPYDPAQHVPFFVRLPGAKPYTCGQLAGMIDYFPTVLDLCGIEAPGHCDGMSLKPLLNGKGGRFPPDRTLIIQCPRGRTAAKWKNASIKSDRWRLVEGRELYNIQADPRQANDIASHHPDVVQRLRAEYEAYWADMPDQHTTLSRHVLGATDCPDVVLNAMDWYRGDRPWNSSAYRGNANGAWAVTIARDGRYVFECRHYPREANKAAGAAHVKMQVGEVVREVEMAPSATHARFELDLLAGNCDLQIWMQVDDKVRGALFVYVSRQP